MTTPFNKLVERWIFRPADCTYVLAWIPADEPYEQPRPGYQKKLF